MFQHLSGCLWKLQFCKKYLLFLYSKNKCSNIFNLAQNGNFHSCSLFLCNLILKVFALKRWIFKSPNSSCSAQSSGVFPSDCYQWSFSITHYMNKRRSYIVLNQMSFLSNILLLTVAMPRKWCKNGRSTQLPTNHYLETSCARPFICISPFFTYQLLFCRRSFVLFLSYLKHWLKNLFRSILET